MVHKARLVSITVDVLRLAASPKITPAAADVYKALKQQTYKLGRAVGAKLDALEKLERQTPPPAPSAFEDAEKALAQALRSAKAASNLEFMQGVAVLLLALSGHKGIHFDHVFTPRGGAWILGNWMRRGAVGEGPLAGMVLHPDYKPPTPPIKK